MRQGYRIIIRPFSPSASRLEIKRGEEFRSTLFAILFLGVAFLEMVVLWVSVLCGGCRDCAWHMFGTHSRSRQATPCNLGIMSPSCATQRMTIGSSVTTRASLIPLWRCVCFSLLSPATLPPSLLLSLPLFLLFSPSS